MKARRTPWWHYLVLFVIFFLIGLIAATWSSRNSSAMMSAPWYLSASIVGVGLVIAWSAWQVRRFVDGKIRKMSPQRSVNTVICAQALALAAAALAGWYGAHFIIAVQHTDIAYFSTVAWQTAIATAACLVDLGLGIVSEFWCLMPPDGEKDK